MCSVMQNLDGKQKHELELFFFVCVYAQCFTCEIGMVMVEVTNCTSPICFIIGCVFVLEYQVRSVIVAFLKAPRCLLIQDCENKKDLVQAA